ncbi:MULTISPECIES: glycoside hydrolase family 127 protein [unclassified Streptomyces]|uniref:glycoside hydrolase family 127 protein n=1 Tax=unclassified Streptomyces TaxID=2593676 RepID=UPI00381437E0
MADPVVPSAGVLTPLGLDTVRLAPGFWGDRQTLNQDVIIGHCLEWMDRSGWIGNFRGEPARGREFADSEVYKLLEAMAWAGDPRFEALESVVARAQEADGYLNTRWSGDRYRDFEWGHELYCFGHLIQAGVARLRRTGPGPLTETARRAADHICRRFMESPEVCGHPEIEMALVELYRATGADRYLEMARRFVERRGTPALADIELGRAYFQDDVPVRDAKVFRGHAVRAMYLACGTVDVAVETGDASLLTAVREQWERTVERRVHLTGGMGSRHAGESFGDDYELPPDRAYSETCAAVGSFMLCHRLLLATGDSRYADLAERTLYNVIATSPALDGRSFYYANPLQVRVPGEPSDGVSPRAGTGLRAPWFSVSCCPNNLARTLASLPAYLATATGDGVQIHHLTPSEIRHDGLALRVETGYPVSGGAEVEVLAAPAAPRTVSLRLPPWASGAEVAAGAAAVRREGAQVHVEKTWRPGDRFRLELPLRPRWVWPDPRIDAVRGCVAVERGPIVYCAENPREQLVQVDTAGPLVEHEEAGLVELEAPATTVLPGHRGWPYGEPPEAPGERTRVRLVPYHRWGNRGPATMRVWLPAPRA